MILVRILVNAAILLVELGLIVAIAWLGWQAPLAFALATGLLGFALGLGLERARLRNELQFYLGRALKSPRTLFVGTVALGEATGKGLLAGMAAVLTFAGTDANRLWWVGVVFAACLFAGTSVLRWLSLTFGAIPARWGYFRLAPLLGLVFSAGLWLLAELQLVPRTALADLTRKVVFETPQVPSIAQASELLFQFKQFFDAVIVSLLAHVVPQQWAQAIGIVLSVNMLTGFVAAVYAVLIAETVRTLEGREREG